MRTNRMRMPVDGDRRARAGILPLIVLICLTLPRSASAADNPILHIELSRYFTGLSAVAVQCDQPFSVLSESGASLAREGAQQAVYFQVVPAIREGNLPSIEFFTEDSEVGKATTARPGERVHLVAPGPSATFTIGTLDAAGHPYRGAFWVGPLAPGTLRVVNEIDLEDYLLGVIKAEIGAGVPLEAMKAQAVAARTYAVRNMGRLSQEQADLDDTTRSQGYLGREGESPDVIEAVEATAGQVLTYDGAVIDALYSTDCGGTNAPGPPDEPYLRPVKDSGCAKEAAWTVTLSDSDMAAALSRASGVDVDILQTVQVTQKDNSGRALEVAFTGVQGVTGSATGVKLRMAIGPNVLRSTLFSIRRVEHGWQFTGKGWGHGEGLCQAGAIARASGRRPETYDKILSDYYPDTKLEDLSPDLVPTSKLALAR